MDIIINEIPGRDVIFRNKFFIIFEEEKI